MLVQPTPVVAHGASGHNMDPSQDPAVLVAELETLRDGLAAGEVTQAEAASCLTTLLANQSNLRANFHFTFPRWTFGGYCTSCLTYACQDSKCSAMLSRYRWAPCPECKGSGWRDIDLNPNGDVYEPCACTFGAVEVPPAYVEA